MSANEKRLERNEHDDRATATTDDALLGGLVFYRQPAPESRGYRVALEAPLLARFALREGARAPFRHVVDLGAGPGAIALMLVVSGWGERATAVEPVPLHQRLAAENAEINRVAARFTVLPCGVAEIPTHPGTPLACDVAVANPPWFDPHEGPVPASEPRASARALRGGSGASIDAFARAARAAMGHRGRFVVSFPAARLVALFSALEAVGLVPKRLRFVHPRAGREAQVAFVETTPGRRGGLVIEPPLIVRGPGDEYTCEAADALWGRWPPAPAPRDDRVRGGVAAAAAVAAWSPSAAAAGPGRA